MANITMEQMDKALEAFNQLPESGIYPYTSLSDLSKVTLYTKAIMKAADNLDKYLHSEGDMFDATCWIIDYYELEQETYGGFWRYD